MGDTYEALRAKSIDQLKSEYDRIAGSTQVGMGFYREEIARREAEEQAKRMLRLTETMKNLTVAVLILTGIGVVVAGIALWVALSHN